MQWKHLNAKQDVSANVTTSVLHNDLKVEAIQMSGTCWRKKHSAIHSYQRILSAIKSELNTCYFNMLEHEYTSKTLCPVEKSQMQNAIYYFISIKCIGKSNL
jgi:hypothetical protein